MNKSELYNLYEIIKLRKNNPEESSYTCYLFEQGLDKILKKCGEECAETIIAAKNKDKDELKNEICDLIFHLMVLMVNEDLSLNEVEFELEKRSQKIGNLKTFKTTEKNS